MFFKSIEEINDFLNLNTTIKNEKRIFPFLNINKAIKLMFKNNNFLENYKYIHVTGTNGKGSVCECISGLFQTHKMNVISFTSPHILDIEERIKYNGKNIKSEEFLKIFNLVYEKTKTIKLIPFEFLFLSFLVYLRNITVDIVILEVGIGGKNDVTNIIPHKEASVITYVDYDHINILGNTLNKIIGEKIGIITNKTKSIFLGDDNNIYVKIKNNIRYKNINLYKYNKEYGIDYKKNEIYVFNHIYKLNNIIPYYQYKNISIATSVFMKVYKDTFCKNYNKEMIKKYIYNFNIPLRFQIINKKEIIDGGHNVTGIINLIKSLKSIFSNKKYIFIYSSMEDKEYIKILNILNKYGKIILFDFKKYYKRAFKIEYLPYQKIYNINEIIDYIKSIGEEYLVIYTGSIYFTSFILKNRGKNEKNSYIN